MALYLPCWKVFPDPENKFSVLQLKTIIYCSIHSGHGEYNVLFFFAYSFLVFKDHNSVLPGLHFLTINNSLFSHVMFLKPQCIPFDLFWMLFISAIMFLNWYTPNWKLYCNWDHTDTEYRTRIASHFMGNILAYISVSDNEHLQVPLA